MTGGRCRAAAGASLVEAMVAVGVLAVTGPLVMAALARAGDGARAARAESRAPAIAEQCLDELRAARRGRSRHFGPLAAGLEFPQDGVMALAFGTDGALLGPLEAGLYRQGLATMEGGEARYVARLSGARTDGQPGRLLTVTVRVEYPAVQPAARRQVVEFHGMLR